MLGAMMEDLLVVAWQSEDAATLIPRHPDTEAVWLPRIGPTGYLLGCRLALLAEAARGPGGGYRTVHLPDLARDIGVSRSTAPHSPIMRSLVRLGHFGLVTENGWTLVVRSRWPEPRRRRTQAAS